MDLAEAAEYAVKKAINLGASQADCFACRRKRMFLRAVDSKEEKERDLEEKTVLGMNLRIIVDKSIAYSYTTELNREKIDRVVEEGLRLTRSLERNERFKSLPEPSKPSKVSGIFDDSFEKVDLEGYLNDLRAFNSELSIQEGDVEAVDTGFILEVENKAIYNSLGVNLKFKRSLGTCYTIVNAVRNGLPASASNYIQSTRLKELKLDDLKPEIVKYLDLGLRLVKAESGVKNVVFDPKALSELMAYTFTAAIDSYNVHEEKSYLSGRKGEIVASNSLTIIDDGLMNGGLLSEPVDAEGTPTKRTVVIEGGVLKSYLYDSYTANIDGVKSTGNAFRDIRGRIEVKPRNEVILGDSIGFDEMLAEIEDGILIREIMGAHSANIGSGAFSVVSPIGYVIEKGELKGSLRNIVLSGVFDELLKNYWMQGGPVKKAGFLVAPMIVFKHVNVIIS